MTSDRDPIADILSENVLEERPPQSRGRRMAFVFGAIGVVAAAVIAARALVGPSGLDATLPPVAGSDPDPTTTTETTVPVVPPEEGRRRSAAAAGDGLIIVFGGEGETTHHVLGDAALSVDGGASWSIRPWFTGPPSRVGATLSYAPTLDGYLLFGGTGTNFTMACPPSCASIRPLEDLWRYRPSDDTWSDITVGFGPEARAGHAAAFDPVRHLLVVFGGLTRGGSSRPTDTNILDETWIYDTSGRSWTQVATQGGPPGLVLSQMVYHPATDRIYLWGGRTQADGDRDDAVWSFDTATYEWERIESPEDAPDSRWSHQLAVAEDGRLLLTGGMWLQSRQLGSGTTRELLPTEEVWWWTPATNVWEPGPSLPEPTMLHASLTTPGGIVVTWGDRTLFLDPRSESAGWVEISTGA